MKKLCLHRSALSEAAITGIAGDTLRAGGIDPCAASNPSSGASALQPGDKMPDGTIYAGISPHTGEAMYAMPTDVSLTLSFNEARIYVDGLNREKAQGHDDWRLPTMSELKMLFNHRAAIGGCDISGSCPAGWYWSAKLSTGLAWGQRFSDGLQLDYGKGTPPPSAVCGERPFWEAQKWNLKFTIDLEPTKPDVAPTPAAPAIGDKMPDGTIYAGVSPDTGKPMYTAPIDSFRTYMFNDALAYAQTRNKWKVLGHDDWRVPTRAELNVLFNNRAAIGGFNESASPPSRFYWSSSSYDKLFAWGQRFSDGYQGNYYKGNPLRDGEPYGYPDRTPMSVRCVR